MKHWFPIKSLLLHDLKAAKEKSIWKDKEEFLWPFGWNVLMKHKKDCSKGYKQKKTLFLAVKGSILNEKTHTQTQNSMEKYGEEQNWMSGSLRLLENRKLWGESKRLFSTVMAFWLGLKSQDSQQHTSQRKLGSFRPRAFFISLPDC